MSCAYVLLLHLAHFTSCFVLDLLLRGVKVSWPILGILTLALANSLIALTLQIISVDPEGEGIASIRPQSLIDMMKVSSPIS